MSLLSQKHLQDEQAAYDWVEAHVWPDGPVCPHCGSVERISKMQGKATRFGLYKCYACRSQFRVTVGTIFEESHIPLRQVAAGRVPDRGQQEGHFSPTNSTAPWGSPSSRRGSCPTASARPCASGSLRPHGRRWRRRGDGRDHLRPRLDPSQGPPAQGHLAHQPHHQLGAQERHPLAGGARRQRPQLPHRGQHRWRRSSPS